MTVHTLQTTDGEEKARITTDDPSLVTHLQHEIERFEGIHLNQEVGHD